MNRFFLLPALCLGVPLLASASPGPAADSQPAAAAQAETPAIDGQDVFRVHCQTCHAAQEGQYSPIGPNLAGVVGREAGAAAFRYSPALKASGITWTPEQLDKYIAAPLAVVPGTRMTIGLADDAQRAAVIGYLAKTGN